MSTAPRLFFNIRDRDGNIVHTFPDFHSAQLALAQRYTPMHYLTKEIVTRNSNDKTETSTFAPVIDPTSAAVNVTSLDRALHGQRTSDKNIRYTHSP